MNNNFSIFICGTPSNKNGFEYQLLQGSSLPGIPSRYLDLYDPSQMNKGKTYILKRELIDKELYTILTEYRGINPNDDNTNRGAYIAVGIITKEAINYNDAMLFFDVISEIHGNLFAYRDKNNAFDTRFTLDNYKIKNMELDMNISYLTDTLSKLSLKKDKEFHNYRLTYNEDKYKNRDMKNIKNFDTKDKVSNPEEIIYLKKIKVLNENLIQKEQEYKSLKEQNDDIQIKYKQYQDEYSKLKQQLTKYSSQYEEYKNENSELKKYKSAYGKITNENNKLKDEISNLKIDLQKLSYTSVPLGSFDYDRPPQKRKKKNIFKYFSEVILVILIIFLLFIFFLEISKFYPFLYSVVDSNSSNKTQNIKTKSFKETNNTKTKLVDDINSTEKL